MIIADLYNSITDFANRFGGVKWNDEECVSEYKKLVDKAIKYGKEPECNREEYSTHGCLRAAIAYVSDRERYCSTKSNEEEIINALIRSNNQQYINGYNDGCKDRKYLLNRIKHLSNIIEKLRGV